MCGQALPETEASAMTLARPRANPGVRFGSRRLSRLLISIVHLLIWLIQKNSSRGGSFPDQYVMSLAAAWLPLEGAASVKTRNVPVANR